MCGRCGQVWHVVMAKMGDKIAKVVCKRCGGHHRYRDENADAQRRRRRRRRARAGAPFGARGATRRRAAARRRRRPPFDPVEAAAPVRRPARATPPASALAHPTFGTGVVDRDRPAPGKVEVVFPRGRARARLRQGARRRWRGPSRQQRADLGSAAEPQRE